MNKIENSDNDDDRRLSEQLRAHASRFKASPALRNRIQTQLQIAAPGQALKKEATFIGGHVFSWQSAGAGLIGGVTLTLALVLSMGPQIGAFIERPSLENALVSRHVTSMGQGRLFDVVSSDKHTVKPWFQGKLDFSPTVLDLAPAGFALRGGRVDHIDGRAVAALAYVHKQHIINAFVWPSEKSRPPVPSTRKGFNLLHWDDGTMQIWLVSDIDAAELNRFSQAWHAQIAAP